MGEHKCRVCGEEFNNLLVHLRKDGKQLLQEEKIRELIFLSNEDIKEDHLEEYLEIKKSIYLENGGQKQCFCGGKIVSIECNTEYNYVVYEIVCQWCFFEWWIERRRK